MERDTNLNNTMAFSLAAGDYICVLCVCVLVLMVDTIDRPVTIDQVLAALPRQVGGWLPGPS